MYRIAEEVENYFYGCSWTKYQQQCLLFGENILRLFRTCANIACKNSGGKKKIKLQPIFQVVQWHLVCVWDNMLDSHIHLTPKR